MTHVETTDLRAALSALLDGTPPLPGRQRFQPLRMGLLGIWQYEEQEFAFHDGRLILRGRNGSGKTKVLEVTSPFLFDANLTARRLDPFGSTARSMRDNLLYGDRRHNIGYVWCEYGRLLPDGTAEYRTLGAGMRAQATKTGAPESWYFLTEQRIGVDFALYKDDRQPRNDSELRDRLGGGAVFSTAETYRSAAADALFGLNRDRFRSLVELLITLRRPKLSENFSVSRLTTMLRDGLPPIEESIVDELARGFDELAQDQDELQDLVATGAEVRRFLDQYQVYARKAARHCAAQVRSAVTKHDDVTRVERTAQQTLDASQQRVESLQSRAEALDTAIAEQDSRVRSLERRPEIEQQEALRSLGQRAAAAEQHAAAAARRLDDAEQEHRSLEQEQQKVSVDLDAEQRRLDSVESGAVEQSEACSLRMEHDMRAAGLRTDPSSASRILKSVVDARRSALQHTRRLLRNHEDAQAAHARGADAGRPRRPPQYRARRGRAPGKHAQLGDRGRGHRGRLVGHRVPASPVERRGAGRSAPRRAARGGRRWTGPRGTGARALQQRGERTADRTRPGRQPAAQHRIRAGRPPCGTGTRGGGA